MTSSSDQIVISDAYQQLQEEIRQLRLVVAALTSERDDLRYHICPELTARYAESIGNYENRLHYQEIMIRELKRRIELVQSAINYERTVSQDEVDQQVDKEYQEFRDKVDEEARQNEQAQKEQREREQRERASRERWQERYGSHGASGTAGAADDSKDGTNADGRSADGSSDGAENEQGTKGDQDSNRSAGAEGSVDADGSERAANAVPDIKELYRKIVRRLHPDGNPDITEREKELFYKAVQAYKDGDIETLQEIYDEIFGDGTAEDVQRELSYEELVALRDQLKTRIESLNMEIDSIKTAFPYTEKEFLDDADQVSKMQAALEARIHEYEETIKQLNQTLQELMKEMQDLKKRKRK